MQKYGFDAHFEADANSYLVQGLVPARIIAEHKGMYRIITATGEKNVRLKGSYLKELSATRDFPAVGDFVMIEEFPQGEGMIHAVLPRKSLFCRSRSVGREDRRYAGDQVVAANFDVVMIVSSLNLDLNQRRLERYLTLAWQSGGIPVVVLTKADLCPDSAMVEEVKHRLAGVAVHGVSAVTGAKMEALNPYFLPGKTTVFLGMSGVGKSTLVNALYGGAIMKVSGIREDDSRGRHTTTHRQLIVLPNGAMIIDTPGMRALDIGEAEAGLSATFEDIVELAADCRFSDCRHGNEPGCAIQAALGDGTLSRERYESYLKLNKAL